MAGEKSPGIAAVLNLLFYGGGYIYVGGRWLIPGVALVALDIGLNIWSLTWFSSPTTPAQAQAMLGPLLWIGCPSFIFGVILAVHAYQVAVKHNDALMSAPPPVDPGPCKQCAGALAYVPLYRTWYCAKCQRYD